LSYSPASGGAIVAGTCRQRVTPTSGRFATIDNRLGFALVPWTLAIDQHLGHHVASVVRKSSVIGWNFGGGSRFDRLSSEGLAEFV
jgi:Protein of unknown function (DUF3363)